MKWSTYQNIPPQQAIKDITHVITSQIEQQPRSLQKRIGPSEIGMECTHCLAAKLAGWEKHETGVPWASTVGTGTHLLLEQFFNRHTQTAYRPERGARFLTEEIVMVGRIGATPITGSTDLLDVEAGMTADWKVVGVKQLQRYRANGPSTQYRVQAHLYAHGWNQAGVKVDTVSICFLPRASNRFDDHHWWMEPYSPQVAQQALARANAIWDALQIKTQAGETARDEWISSLPRADGCWDCRKYGDSPAKAVPTTLADLDQGHSHSQASGPQDLNTIMDIHWDLMNGNY